MLYEVITDEAQDGARDAAEAEAEKGARMKDGCAKRQEIGRRNPLHPGDAAGLLQGVITSYSIHYTKLYELGTAGDRRRHPAAGRGRPPGRGGDQRDSRRGSYNFV